MRVVGWQESLAQVFSDAHGKPFRWGTHDCCLFVARCSRALTGVDRRAIFAAYRTRLEAQEILATCGGMRGLLTRAFGEPVHCSRATHGDIVLIDMGRGEQPAVCMGVKSWAPGRRALEWRDTLTASAAWVL